MAECYSREHHKTQPRCKCGSFTTVDWKRETDYETLMQVDCGCSGSSRGKTVLRL